MDSTKDFKRTTLPFDKRIPIPKDSKEILVNNFGLIRAVIDGGVLLIQAKKHKGKQREMLRVDTNVSPPTIELILEKPQS